MAVCNEIKIGRSLRGRIVWFLVVTVGLLSQLSAQETKPAAASTESPATESAPADQKPPIDATHPLFRPLELAYKSRETLKGLKDYEAVFVKRELLPRRRKPTTTSMMLKFRSEPFSVYLLYANPNKGREVIFVQGKNDNKLLAHETGVKALAGTVPLDPNSRDALEENKYPVTMIGIHNLLEKVIAQWEAEGEFGETTVLFYSPKDTKLGDRPCSVIESQHPQPRDEFKFKMTRLFLDEETNYPVRVEQYGFPGRGEKELPLAEEYTYSQIKANPGLTDRDFDIKNPAYAFPQ